MAAKKQHKTNRAKIANMSNPGPNGGSANATCGSNNNGVIHKMRYLCCIKDKRVN